MQGDLKTGHQVTHEVLKCTGQGRGGLHETELKCDLQRQPSWAWDGRNISAEEWKGALGQGLCCMPYACGPL